ncbi:T9SS type A sorting domain-containing protein [Hymenobacter convexus]|uniref:T9SS type A sorting domain-containing protein n=1 Tax=Hymenobacter sp. CA1UV-4 TaxID=3063782 RepID=UPI0027136816|nr:T9SS type A sorting domain-containing protein [Hymenobacter sp. CA1UV-4]MDO7854164.1 T9SS type A sorting domain-containing protein [Hymenobacter sp. CA1UV-4]
MQTATLTSVFCVRLLRAWLVPALVILLVASGRSSYSQALPAYYSTTGPTNPVTTGGTVTAGVNAGAGALSAFATVQVSGASVAGSPVSVRFGLTGEAPAGYRAGVVVANTSSTLSLTALGAVRLRTYLGGVVRETRLVRADVLEASLGVNSLPTQLEFTSTLSFDAVEFEVLSVASLNRSFNVFYAYGVRPGIQTRGYGYLSRFDQPTAGTEYRTSVAGGPLLSLCVNTDVTNPEQVADVSLTNFATLRSTATVACNPAIYAKLAGVPAGGTTGSYYAGFVIGQSSLLDVSVLSGLEISTYLGNTLVETRSGLNLLNLNLLGGNTAMVSFKTDASKRFDGVRISRVGLLKSIDLTVLDDLNVYYAFGLEPQAIEGLNPILSNFANPLPNDAYSSSPPQQVSVDVNVTIGIVTTRLNGQLLEISRVVNPQLAADNTIPTSAATTNYAELNTLGVNLSSINPIADLITLATPLTSQATASLKLKLNGTGKAGNRVGFAVGKGGGLLDLTALQRLTIATYDANNKLIETKTGSSLLGVTLLGTTDITRISFLASRDFTYAELTVTSAASVLSNTRVYYAFAEDVPLLSLAAPLPVELTAFGAKWNNGAADLTWTTASEKNSSYFVVERATSAEAAFEAVGQVAAAGSSTRALTYKLRDAEAGAKGVSVLYYRLRQVDRDGTFSYSPVASVTVGKLAAAAPQLQVYPNPALDARAVLVRCPNLPATGGLVQAYSQLGQLVGQVPVSATGEAVQMPTLKPGLYHVVLRDAAGQALATQRLVVGNR